MKKISYKSKAIERAHWWIAKALDSLEEARMLIPSGKTRMGAYNRLYYCVHHSAVALLRLVGDNANSHKAVLRQFGKAWVKDRGFPSKYGRVLHTLHDDRRKADYGEFVPSMQRDLERRLKQTELFVRRANKEIPPVSTANILRLLVQENPRIRDFSLDLYCPKSYYSHTRFTAWSPKGRITDRWLKHLLNSQVKTLKALGIKEANYYVLGLNSRVNQYEEEHLVMLDFDNVSSIPYEKFKDEPGFFSGRRAVSTLLGPNCMAFLSGRKKCDRMQNWLRDNISNFP